MSFSFLKHFDGFSLNLWYSPKFLMCPAKHCLSWQLPWRFYHDSFFHPFLSSHVFTNARRACPPLGEAMLLSARMLLPYFLRGLSTPPPPPPPAGLGWNVTSSEGQFLNLLISFGISVIFSHNTFPYNAYQNFQFHIYLCNNCLASSQWHQRQEQYLLCFH